MEQAFAEQIQWEPMTIDELRRAGLGVDKIGTMQYSTGSKGGKSNPPVKLSGMSDARYKRYYDDWEKKVGGRPAGAGNMQFDLLDRRTKLNLVSQCDRNPNSANCGKYNINPSILEEPTAAAQPTKQPQAPAPKPAAPAPKPAAPAPKPAAPAPKPAAPAPKPAAPAPKPDGKPAGVSAASWRNYKRLSGFARRRRIDPMEFHKLGRRKQHQLIRATNKDKQKIGKRNLHRQLKQFGYMEDDDDDVVLSNTEDMCIMHVSSFINNHVDDCPALGEVDVHQLCSQYVGGEQNLSMSSPNIQAPRISNNTQETPFGAPNLRYL